MSYIDQPRRLFSLGAARIILGALAAAAVPSVVLTWPGLDEAQFVFFFGCASILTAYLPLMFWRLPRTRHPLMLSILLGVIAAPGPVGLGLVVGMPLVAPWVLLISAPFGALGGAVFWLCAVRRNPDLEPELA